METSFQTVTSPILRYRTIGPVVEICAAPSLALAQTLVGPEVLEPSTIAMWTLDGGTAATIGNSRRVSNRRSFRSVYPLTSDIFDVGLGISP